MNAQAKLAKAIQWLEGIAMDEETAWAQERAKVLLKDRALLVKERNAAVQELAALSVLAARADAAEKARDELLHEKELQAINHEYVAAQAGALSSGVGLARLALADGRAKDAKRNLDEACDRCPDFAEYMDRYDIARAALLADRDAAEQDACGYTPAERAAQEQADAVAGPNCVTALTGQPPTEEEAGG